MSPINSSNGRGSVKIKMDEILEGLEKLKDEWQNRTELKQNALKWAISKRLKETFGGTA